MDASRPNAIFLGNVPTDLVSAFPIYLLLNESKIKAQKTALASLKSTK